jgi:hypothetical protein
MSCWVQMDMERKQGVVSVDELLKARTRLELDPDKPNPLRS